MRAVVLALALTGCAAANGAGVTASRDGMSWVDAAPLSVGVWMVSCDNALSYCTDRAGKLCPSGFDVADVSSGTRTSGAIGAYGGGVNQRTKYHVQVTCKT